MHVNHAHKPCRKTNVILTQHAVTGT